MFDYCSHLLVENWDIKFAFTLQQRLYSLYEKACVKLKFENTQTPGQYFFFLRMKDSKAKLGIEERYSWHLNEYRLNKQIRRIHRL